MEHDGSAPALYALSRIPVAPRAGERSAVFTEAETVLGTDLQSRRSILAPFATADTLAGAARAARRPTYRAPRVTLRVHHAVHDTARRRDVLVSPWARSPAST